MQDYVEKTNAWKTTTGDVWYPPPSITQEKGGSTQLPWRFFQVILKPCWSWKVCVTITVPKVSQWISGVAQGRVFFGFMWFWEEFKEVFLLAETCCPGWCDYIYMMTCLWGLYTIFQGLILTWWWWVVCVTFILWDRLDCLEFVCWIEAVVM